MSEDFGVLAPYGQPAGPGGYDGLPIALQGRYWSPRPLWASYLYALANPAPAQWDADLTQLASLGFTGVRVFAGALQQVSLTPAQSRDRLPGFLTLAARLGLFVHTSAITNSAVDGGYDIAAHLSAIAGICSAAPNSLLEVANEPYHATQNATCHDPVALLALARTYGHGLSFALGAAEEDEVDRDGVYAYEGGAWNTAHLNRSRDFWNCVRRVKELWEISHTLNTPVMSGEPIGAAPQSDPGKREADPLWFYTYGLLCRAFDIGCVFHSQQGLLATPLTGNELACAQACLAGFSWPPAPDRYTFYNAGWPDSPVAGADFTKVVRCYSFVSGPAGFTACLDYHPEANIQWGAGWTPGATLDLTSPHGTLRLVTLSRS